MLEPKSHDTSSIGGWFCSACGWPVIHACCNDEMAEVHPQSDWWAYCSNQGCKNHAGEDWGQHPPCFVQAGHLDSDQPPPASQDWTPHDRYTAAALTGLLARGNRGNADQIALWALDQADAMMKWRDVPLDERGSK